MFPVLYKYTSKGQIQQWQIFVEGDKYYTQEGIQGGKLTQSLPTYCTGKNKGKKNETTNEQQALKEAAAKHKKKVDSGYNEVLTDKKNYFEPMLAEEYAKGEKVVFKVRTFIQPKLDGIRCSNKDGKLMSRNGKEFVSCPHLAQKEVHLDGELYNHLFHDNFGKISSLVKKTKPTKADIEESKELVQMWVYDFPDYEGVFSERYQALAAWVRSNDNPAIRLVPTYEVYSQKEVDKYNEQFLAQGFEGSIIRLDSGPYENKRTKQLLKYKEFEDSEFEIVGYEEGKGSRAGTIGKFVLKHDRIEGVTFESNIKGDFDFLKDVWVHRNEYIGTTATVKHFKRTPDDIPRFPYITKLNRESYE